MSKKKEPQPGEPSQSERFKRFAREVGADDDGEALERTFKKVAPPSAPPRERS